MPVARERASLVRALSTVAFDERRNTARRFLQGLSTEELRYIASYFGACLLESAAQVEAVSRSQIAAEILQYECWREGSSLRGIPEDRQHNMILLVEYLTCCRCASAMRIPAGSA